MKEYISTIIYICIFCIILELILPNNKLKKYVGVLVSLILLLTLFKPVINVINSDAVVATISSALENIKSDVNKKYKSYDFSDLKNKTILGSVKQQVEEELYNACKKEFDALNITKVNIELDNSYKIKKVVVKAKALDEIAKASNVIAYLENQYDIDGSTVEVIKEE